MADYDTIAPGYNELYGSEQVKKARIILDNLPWKLEKEWKLLDVGAGTGISTVIFPLPAENKSCIDPSKELLALNPYNSVLGHAEDMPFAGHQFDLVISITAVHNFNDIERGLQEIKRVGKGRFVITVLKKSERFDEIGQFIRKNFSVKLVVDSEKDKIFFLE